MCSPVLHGAVDEQMVAGSNPRSFCYFSSARNKKTGKNMMPECISNPHPALSKQILFTNFNSELKEKDKLHMFSSRMCPHK